MSEDTVEKTKAVCRRRHKPKRSEPRDYGQGGYPLEVLTREPGVVTAASKVMSQSKADAECQRAKGHATSAQVEERKRLD